MGQAYTGRHVATSDESPTLDPYKTASVTAQPLDRRTGGPEVPAAASEESERREGADHKEPCSCVEAEVVAPGDPESTVASDEKRHPAKRAATRSWSRAKGGPGTRHVRLLIDQAFLARVSR